MPDEKAKELRFVQVIDPNLFGCVPRKLFKQAGMTETQTDNAIRYGKHTLNRYVAKNGELVLIPNILVHIALLIDSENKIRGIIWANFDVIEELIFVQLASIERAYQGGFRKSIVEYLFGLEVDNRCKGKIRMATSRPRAYKKSGWKPAPMTLMEIDYEDMGTTDPEESGEA